MPGYIEKKPRLNTPSGKKAKIIFLDHESACVAQKKNDDFIKKNPRKKKCRFVDEDGNVVYYTIA